MPRLLFGAWEPDNPQHLSNNVTIARNVFAGKNGYRPLKQFVAANEQLADVCLGAASFTAPQGGSSIIAGTRSNLYSAQFDGWATIASGYGMQPDDRWRFVQFGGMAIATNGTDPIQKIELAAMSVDALGGNPPKARHLLVVKDFLVALSIDDDVRTMAWSGINNAEWWTFGQNQSDYNIMPTGGALTGGFGGEVGIILQRNRITRMTYVGDNVVFQFDEISSNVGCVTANSVAQWGAVGFFLSDTGFMMWDGSALRPIGQEKIDRYFKERYDRPSLDDMKTAIDPLNSIVMWAMLDACYVYNWLLDRWTSCDFGAQYVFSGVTRDIALDELDAPFPVLDTIPISLDDQYFKGDDPRFYVFDTLSRLGTFSGSPMETELAFGDLELSPGREARIQWLRPLSDIEDGLTASIGTKQRLGEAYQVTDYSLVEDSGDISVRERGRFQSLTQLTAEGAAWTFAQGFDVVLAAGAKR